MKTIVSFKVTEFPGVKKPHLDGESLVLPAAIHTVETVFC
jgi:hypothetical protein